VRVHSENPLSVSAEELTKLALQIAKEPDHSVWFYLPGMDATKSAWAVST
jgi:hypothetical protein